MSSRVSTGRACVCGEEIVVTERVAAFGAARGKDPKEWPARCAHCVAETVLAMFAAVDESEPLVLEPPAPASSSKEKLCATCSALLGPKHYAGVPGQGDLCLVCWEIWRKGQP